MKDLMKDLGKSPKKNKKQRYRDNDMKTETTIIVLNATDLTAMRI